MEDTKTKDFREEKKNLAEEDILTLILPRRDLLKENIKKEDHLKIIHIKSLTIKSIQKNKYLEIKDKEMKWLDTVKNKDILNLLKLILKVKKNRKIHDLWALKMIEKINNNKLTKSIVLVVKRKVQIQDKTTKFNHKIIFSESRLFLLSNLFK